jgi:glutathione-specific gamma-glutamylcyclotransferase
MRQYLYLTVKHLEQWGIRDRNLWQLQKLVAREIEVIHRAGDRIGRVGASNAASNAPCS